MMLKKAALTTEMTGQDGAYLNGLLWSEDVYKAFVFLMKVLGFTDTHSSYKEIRNTYQNWNR